MFSPWSLLPAAAICIVTLHPVPSPDWSANKRFNNPSCFMGATAITGDPALLGISCMFLFASVFTHTTLQVSPKNSLFWPNEQKNHAIYQLWGFWSLIWALPILLQKRHWAHPSARTRHHMSAAAATTTSSARLSFDFQRPHRSDFELNWIFWSAGCCSSWPGLPEPPSLRSRSKQRSHSFRALPASKTLSVWTCVLSLYLKLKAKMSPTHIWELPRWRKWL